MLIFSKSLIPEENWTKRKASSKGVLMTKFSLFFIYLYEIKV